MAQEMALKLEQRTKAEEDSEQQKLKAEYAHIEAAGEIDEHKLAEGRFRDVYGGFYRAPNSKKGERCVVKLYSDKYPWQGHSFKNTIEINKVAMSLASDFNKENLCHSTVEFVKVLVDTQDQTKYEALMIVDFIESLTYTPIIIEDFIPGHFQKWCSNYGYIDEEDTVLPAFMHWSYIKTKGRMMVADLQGVKTETGYMLTDPVIMSDTPGQLYGATDTGIEGIMMFFLNHSCSPLCAKFPKPSYELIRSYFPLGHKFTDSLKSHTALAQDLSLPMKCRCDASSWMKVYYNMGFKKLSLY